MLLYAMTTQTKAGPGQIGALSKILSWGPRTVQLVAAIVQLYRNQLYTNGILLLAQENAIQHSNLY